MTSTTSRVSPSRVASILLAAALAVGTASAQAPESRVTVKIEPSQTVEERIADEIKAKELLREGSERSAAAESARLAETSPAALLRRARTFYVSSNTSFFTPELLQFELQKRTEIEEWGYAIVDGWGNREIADVLVEIDRPLFTYTFTYKLTSRGSGIVLAVGKVTAFNGNAAAPRLAKKIVKDIQLARSLAKPRP
jgi:hypothetical protein